MKNFEIAARLLAATKLPGVGARTVQKAVDSKVNCSDSEAFIEAIIASSSRISRDSISSFSFDDLIGDAWDCIETASNDGQKIITYLDPVYPIRLRDLNNPPLILFCKGNCSLLYTYEETPTIAVVGSRKAGDYGLRVAERFGEVLAEDDCIVLSGLAIGCDACAHMGCLEKDGSTIAVLPSPLNKVVPEQHAELADRIISKHGLLVSELAPGTKIERSSFVQRNRIQAALADKVIIIETSVNGGTMRTAEFAQRLNRPLAAYSFPEKFKSPDNEGNDELIAKGLAAPLSDATSISSFLKARTSSEEQLPLPL